MARNLPPELDAAQLHTTRSPTYRVEIFNVRGTSDTISNIVLGDPLQAGTGPRDVTEFVSRVDFLEEAGDFVEPGIAASALTLTLEDPDRVLDPDSGSEPQWLRQGNVVRLYEGDAQAPGQEVLTFTGKLRGQAGIARGRVPIQGALTVRALSREADYLPYKTTSRNFPIGTAVFDFADTIAREEMELAAGEIDWPSWGATLLGSPVQSVEEVPLVAIARAMLGDGLLPSFSGEGKLAVVNGNVTKGPSRIYLDDGQFFTPPERAWSDFQGYNRVCVTGLDANLSKVVQPFQPLRGAQVTTGYFSPNEDLPVFWSEDRTILAENVRLRVVKSVNGGLSILGGSEGFSEISAPFEGSSGANLEIESGFAPIVIIFLSATYAALAAIPDTVVTVPLAGTGQTIPVGRIIQAGALAGIMLIQSKIGSGDYVFEGTPFEYVNRTLEGCAEVDGILVSERNELRVENHLLSTQQQVDDAGEILLRREVAKGNVRRVTMVHDLKLEADDVFERFDGRRYLIRSISRTLARDPGVNPVATVDCFEITPGVLP